MGTDFGRFLEIFATMKSLYSISALHSVIRPIGCHQQVKIQSQAHKRWF